MDVSPSTIRYYINIGKLPSVKTNITKVNLDDVKELIRFSVTDSNFGDIVLEPNESLRPLEPFLKLRGTFTNPLKYKTSQRYMISNYGRVFNIDTNTELVQSKADHGYLQVSLARYGEKTLARVHRLVAPTWCDNGKFKQYPHHIDGDRTNNRDVNLLWTTLDEHKEAHRLFTSANTTRDFEEYNKFVEEIRTDNRIVEPYYCVPYINESNSISFLYLSEKGYRKLKEGEDIENLFCEIRGEFFSQDKWALEKLKRDSLT